MTEADYVWLANDNLPEQTIRVVKGSEWHYAQGGWHETDPVPDLTAADIEAELPTTRAPDSYPVGYDPDAQAAADVNAEMEEAEAELAEDEQEPDPQPPAEESE